MAGVDVWESGGRGGPGNLAQALCYQDATNQAIAGIVLICLEEACQ